MTSIDYRVINALISTHSFTLVRHPAVLAKLRTEISTTCQSKSELDRNDLRNMKYLQIVMKESE